MFDLPKRFFFSCIIHDQLVKPRVFGGGLYVMLDYFYNNSLLKGQSSSEAEPNGLKSIYSSIFFGLCIRRRLVGWYVPLILVFYIKKKKKNNFKQCEQQQYQKIKGPHSDYYKISQQKKDIKKRKRKRNCNSSKWLRQFRDNYNFFCLKEILSFECKL